MSNERISVVVPMYKEEKVLPLFYEQIERVRNKDFAEFEFVFVDDGSTDNTLDIIK